MRQKRMVTDWFGFFALRFCALTVITGFVVRIILMLMPMTEINFGLTGFLRLFLLGAVNDIAFSAIGAIPAFVIYSGMTDGKYSRPFNWIIDIVLGTLTFYVVFFNDITDEYGSVVPTIANSLLILLLLCYNLKLFLPGLRSVWRKITIYGTMGVYAACVILFNIVGEPVFWEEFSVRYNFIAVDYLVYTNEVVGNIVESYPMALIIAAVVAGSAAIVWGMCRGCDLSRAGISGVRGWLVSFVALGLSAFAGGVFLHWGYRNLQTEDMYLTQLQQNGCWDFLEAYSSSELDYRQFYRQIPDEDAVRITREICRQNGNGVQQVLDSLPELKKNIVLVTVESLSASFLSAYGNEKGLTPNIDSILCNSLAFDNLFATGNRTVRGLEAVTLCIPPCSGESLVKRPGNQGLFSTAMILRQNGYSTTFIYGGDSYFDNMKAFFGGNGYDIHDKGTYDKSGIVFDNVWGTCDEDSYREATALFDSAHEAGKSFFAHIMTISNHRPYTYPEGRIEFEGNPMSRDAAVKYTDYALGKFLADAALRPWFENTVFVIMADHCASSAGKTSLPLDGYHIPAMIYAPGFVEPQRVSKLCSQIDLMPTLFNMLHLKYDSRFYGQDILDENFHERALMATYQDLGYYRDGVLTVLSPVRQLHQFRVSEPQPWQFREEAADGIDPGLAEEAMAIFQTANCAY